MKSALVKGLVLATAFGLAACDNGGSSNNTPVQKPGDPVTLNEQNTTDTSVCSSGTPASSIVGSWGFSMTGSSPSSPLVLTENLVLTLNADGSGSITNNCSSNSGEGESATAPITYTSSGNSFSITNGGSASNKTPDGSFTCSVSASAFSGATYSFQGSCLVLQNPTGSGSLTLVPASGFSSSPVVSSFPTGPVNSGPVTPSTDPAIQAANDKCQNTPQQGMTDMRYVMSQTVNGASCTTGCHIFNNSSDYCQALQNDSLNNDCAKDQRLQTYQQACVGN